MTSKQKAKGYRYEKKTEELLNSINGCIAKRNYMSGALKNEVPELDGDISLTTMKLNSDGISYIDEKGEEQYSTLATIIKGYKVEVKARDKAFPKWIRNSLTQGDFCVMWDCSGKGKESVPYVLMPFEVFKGLIE